jgi:hypothetical protein
VHDASVAQNPTGRSQQAVKQGDYNSLGLKPPPKDAKSAGSRYLTKGRLHQAARQQIIPSIIRRGSTKDIRLGCQAGHRKDLHERDLIALLNSSMPRMRDHSGGGRASDFAS